MILHLCINKWKLYTVPDMYNKNHLHTLFCWIYDVKNKALSFISYYVWILSVLKLYITHCWNWVDKLVQSVLKKQLQLILMKPILLKLDILKNQCWYHWSLHMPASTTMNISLLIPLHHQLLVNALGIPDCHLLFENSLGGRVIWVKGRSLLLTQISSTLEMCYVPRYEQRLMV
jgi:hypothetical protein